jgi:hypothetical protein
MFPSSPRRARFAFAAAFAAVSVVVPFAPAARAQEEPAAPAPAAPQPPRRSIRSLNDVIAEMPWDPAVRGPLIVVAPERAGPKARTAKLGPDGFSVAFLSGLFDFRLIPCGTVAAFAPATMEVLASKLPKPDLFSEFNRHELVTLLQASFTEQQWRTMGSEQGLGSGDLTPRQRELFDALIPNPLVVERQVADETGKTTTRRTTLSAGQRAGARLSLRKRLAWSFPVGDNGFLGVGTSERRPNSEALEVPQDPRTYPRYDSDAPVYGLSLIQKERARLKPGDLPFDWNGLDAQVSLEGAKTLGDLIQRARQATRVELYADRRYVGLSVHARGGSARAGDVLTALCYGVTGTFRKVGNAFVLTDDREGYGTRVARLAEWVKSATDEANAMKAQIEEGKRKRPRGLTAWDRTDPNGGETALIGRYTEFQKRFAALPREERYEMKNRNLLVPVAELPPAVRTLVEKQGVEAGRVSPSDDPSRKVRTDVVRLHTEDAMTMVIPGVGEARVGFLSQWFANDDLNNPDPTEQPPYVRPEMELPVGIPAPPSRSVIVAPETPGEAVTLVREAARRGYTRVWVAVRADEIAPVEAAVKAGKEAKISVGAVVRVLRAGGDTSLPRDRNILEEDSTTYANRAAQAPGILQAGVYAFLLNTGGGYNPNYAALARSRAAREKRWGPWLACDSPRVRAAVVSRLTALAKIPGLAGVVLRDLHAPGHHFNPAPGLERSAFPFDPLGYTEPSRLEFLRRHGVDPVDLSIAQQVGVPNRAATQLNLPFFPDYGVTGKYADNASFGTGTGPYQAGAGDAAEKWTEFRSEVANAFATGVYADVRKAAPTLPLWVYRGADDAVYGGTRFMVALDDTPESRAFLAPPPEPVKRSTEGDSAPPPSGAAFLARMSRGTKAVAYVYEGVRFGEEKPVEYFARTVANWAYWLKEGWREVTFDLADYPPAAVPGVLNAVKFVQPEPEGAGAKDGSG